MFSKVVLPFSIPTSNCMSILFILTSDWPVFFIIPVLVGVKVMSPYGFNLYFSFMTDDVETLFMCILAICISSFVKSVQFFFAHFY